MSAKLGFNATWSMAFGGMVGGGIFSTLPRAVLSAVGRPFLPRRLRDTGS